jgi:bifunctional DNase/RNase
MIPVRVHGITADPTTNQFLMLLVDDAGKRLLPIVIGQWEAQSIAWNMQGIKMQRPLTHDLFKSFLNSANIKITKVIIDNLKDNTFFATIKLTANGNKFEIDSRPSDAVAIALRMNAPIFVSDEVFDKASVKIDTDFIEEIDEIAKLNKELKNAIDREDYEKAAEIRDKLKEIESKNKNEN